MLFRLVAVFSVMFSLAIFVIILILHSFALDPDTKDVPKHLRALKAFAWVLTVLCIYYDAGETSRGFQEYLSNIILILGLVLLSGLWYILKLPGWYQKSHEEQERKWEKAPSPRIANDLEDTRRMLAEQGNRDGEARRQKWKIRERERFSLDDGAASKIGNVGGTSITGDDGEAREVREAWRTDEAGGVGGDVPGMEQDEMESRSGYELYQYLEDIKHYNRPENDVLEYREVLWWVDPKDQTLKCVSDFTDESQWAPIPAVNGDESLAKNPSTLFMTCVSVESPVEVRPAITLIRTALEKIHYYDKYYGESSRTQFQNSVAVGCQFKKYPTEKGKFEGEDDELVSCMTVCVDKILVVNFHIIHMIEAGRTRDSATATVREIGYLFSELILNRDIIKFWFNYQSDIKAMDATLDEIFRGTPRPTLKMNDDPNSPEQPSPSYKLPLTAGQARAFRSARPEDLTFHKVNDSPWGTECPYDFHINSVDAFGHPCPCRTENFDLAVVTEFIIRDLHMEDPRSELKIRPWTEARSGGTYSHFQNCMLLGDKYEKLLKLFGDIGIDKVHPPPTYPVPCLGTCTYSECDDRCKNGQLKRDYVAAVRRFGRGFSAKFSKPGFQSTPQLLGFAVGRVVGLALVARFLMTTENPRLLAERLRFWSFLPTAGPRPVPKFGRPVAALGPQRLVRFKPKWDLRSKLIRHISLYVDNTAFAEEDLIGWDISGDQSIRKVIGKARKWRCITKDSEVLYDIIWRFMKTNPVLFGDFIYSYSTKPYRPGLRDGDGNFLLVDEQREERPKFSKEAISAIFHRKPFSSLYTALLPMLIAQLELLLLAELARDDDNVTKMVEEFDERRREIGAIPNEEDRRKFLNAKEALGKKYTGPSWRPKNIIPITLYSVGRWIFKPLQEFSVFPDRYNLGLELLGGLVTEFRSLATVGRDRLRKSEEKLTGLTGGQGQTLLRASTEGMKFFPFPEYEWMWTPSKNGKAEIKDRIEIFVGFWIKLFFETAIPRAVDGRTGEEYLTFNDEEDRVDGTRFGEKVYELTFSPTNFYMPVFETASAEPGLFGKRPKQQRYKRGRKAKAVAAGRFGGASEETRTGGETDWGAWDKEVGMEFIQGGWDGGDSGSTRDWWDVEKPDDEQRLGTAPPSPVKEPRATLRDQQFKRLFDVWIDTILGPPTLENAFPR